MICRHCSVDDTSKIQHKALQPVGASKTFHRSHQMNLSSFFTSFLRVGASGSKHPLKLEK